MELSKYVYFCAQKSNINAGNNKFQDLINAPHMYSTTIETRKSMTFTALVLYEQHGEKT